MSSAISKTLMESSSSEGLPALLMVQNGNAVKSFFKVPRFLISLAGSCLCLDWKEISQFPELFYQTTIFHPGSALKPLMILIYSQVVQPLGTQRYAAMFNLSAEYKGCARTIGRDWDFLLVGVFQYL